MNDGRFTLSPDREKELLAELALKKKSRKQLSREYGVSKTKIWNLCNPEKAEKNYQKRKKQGNPYYTKEKQREYMARYRAKKAKSSKD